MARDKGNRKAARLRGEKTYLGGKVCPKGHGGPRYTIGGGCVECSKAFSRSNRKKEYDREYYKSNAERIGDRSKRYYKENREYVISRVSEWGQRNPGKVRYIKQSYKYRRRLKEGEGISWAQLKKWEERQRKECYWCGDGCADEYHVDHYIPLSKGGEHVESNLVIACPGCNRRKSAKMPEDFLAEQGRLA